MPHQPSLPGWLSVTECLSLGMPKVNVSSEGRPYFFLEQWRGRVGNKEADVVTKEGQRIGTAVHELIENFFRGQAIPDTDLRQAQMVKNLREKFVVPYDVRPEKLEVSLQNPDLKLQGTIDGLISTSKIGYETCLVDWKTSNSLDKIGGPLQLSAYDHLIKGNGKGVLVRIDKKKDKVEIEWYPNLKQYWPLVMCVMKTARYIKFGEIPN